MEGSGVPLWIEGFNAAEPAVQGRARRRLRGLPARKRNADRLGKMIQRMLHGVVKKRLDDFLDDFGALHADELLVEAAVKETEALGVEAHEMEYGRVEIADVAAIDDGFVA